MKKWQLTGIAPAMRSFMAGASLCFAILGITGCGGETGGVPSGITGSLTGVQIRTNGLSVPTSGGIPGTINPPTGATTMVVKLLGAAYDKSDVILKFNLAQNIGGNWQPNDGVQLYEYFAKGSTTPFPDPWYKGTGTPPPALFYVDSTSSKRNLICSSDPYGLDAGTDNAKIPKGNIPPPPLTLSTSGVQLQAGAFTYAGQNSYILRQASVNILFLFYNGAVNDANLIKIGTLVETANVDLTGRIFNVSVPENAVDTAKPVGSPVVSAAISQWPSNAAYLEYVLIDGGTPGIVSSSGLVPIPSVAGQSLTLQCSIPNRNLPFFSAVFAYYNTPLNTSGSASRTPFAYLIGSPSFTISPPTALAYTDTSLTSTWKDAVGVAASSVGNFTWSLPGALPTQGSKNPAGTITDGQTFTVAATANITTFLPPTNANTGLVNGFVSTPNVAIVVPNSALGFTDKPSTGTLATDPLGLTTSSPGVLTANLGNALNGDHSQSFIEDLVPSYGTANLGTFPITILPKVQTVPLTASVTSVPIGAQSVVLTIIESGMKGVMYTSILPVNNPTSPAKEGFTVSVADRGNTYTAHAIAYSGTNGSGGILGYSSQTSAISASAGAFPSITLQSNVASIGFTNNSTSLTLVGNSSAVLRPKLSLNAVSISGSNGSQSTIPANATYISPIYCTFASLSPAGTAGLSIDNTGDAANGTVTSTIGSAVVSSNLIATTTVSYAGVTSGPLTITAIPLSAGQNVSWNISGVPEYAQSIVIQVTGTDPVGGSTNGLTYQAIQNHGAYTGSSWSTNVIQNLGVFVSQGTQSAFTGTVSAFSGPNGTGTLVDSVSIGSAATFGALKTSVVFSGSLSGITLYPTNSYDVVGTPVPFRVVGTSLMSDGRTTSSTFPLSTDSNLTFADSTTGHLTASSGATTAGLTTYTPNLPSGFLGEGGDVLTVTAFYGPKGSSIQSQSTINVIPFDGTANGNVNKFHSTHGSRP